MMSIDRSLGSRAVWSQISHSPQKHNSLSHFPKPPNSQPPFPNPPNSQPPFPDPPHTRHTQSLVLFGRKRAWWA